MIGGVLVERTVEDVVPNLQTNLEGVRLLVLSLAIMALRSIGAPPIDQFHR